jgi:UDP-glucose 4-epimerase
VVEVLLDTLHRRVTHATPVNLAFGSRVSLLELVGALEALVGHSLPRSHTELRAGDVAHSQADQGLLRTLVPDVRPVPLDEGLRATAAWFEEQKH